MQRWLALTALMLFACDDGAPESTTTLPPPGASALRLVYPAGIDSVVCNGRQLTCAPRAGGCFVDLDAGAQGWTDGVVLCQGVEPEPLFAPVIPVVFKDGLPIWTPNLNAAGEIVANPRTTAAATAFLSPYLTVTWPETARAVLGQTQDSPYFEALVRAVDAKDEAAAAEALPPIAADVLAQATLTQALSDSSRDFGLDHIKVERTSGYVTVDSRLGTPVDHICVIHALDACGIESEVALAATGNADVFEKTRIGRAFVPAKSYFDLRALAKTALTELFGDLVPAEELETFRLEPGRVHDIQCYSGALGLADEADARSDAILIAAEPDGRALVNFARVANLISVAIDTLQLFVDFKAFDDKGDIAKSVAICAEQSLGPALELADGATREAWFDLLKVVQTCAIKRLGVILAKRGVHAVALWVFDFALGGGGGWVGKISRSGMIIDRIVGMTLTMSPVQRSLMAEAVDFEACAPCEDACDATACVDDGHYQPCVQGDECRIAEDPIACEAGTICEAGDCVACGEAGEPCCADDTCAAGLGCAGDTCVVGCREECPANGVTRCAHRGAVQVCGEHDGDPCLEWGAAEDCAIGEACEDDACGPPSCEDECDALDAEQCTPDGSGLDVCGQCDADGCLDWCPGEACAANFECVDLDCVCVEESDDLAGVYPGRVLPALDDDGEAHIERNSLWPARDVDVISAYVNDTPGNTLRPTVAVTNAGPDLRYDVCVAFECDPAVNGGDPSSVDCGDAIRTSRDGAPACCLLEQQGDAEVAIDINCTIGGLRDDSGTAIGYVEASGGSQCAPALRITLTGGED